MSTSTEYMDGLNAPAERRFYPRVAPPSPIWVAFGPNNLGVLQDLSENGFQISTPTSLAINSVYRVLIPLKTTRKTVVVTVRTIWTYDDENRSGIQLLDLSDEDRKHIRQLVAAELIRLETRHPEFDDSAIEPLRVAPAKSSAESRLATGIDNDAGVVNVWPAEWQREDWQHIDVEHAPGEAASSFESNVRTECSGASPDPVAQMNLEPEPEFAAHLESKNQKVEDAGAGETNVFPKENLGQSSELNGMDRGGDLTAEKISPDIDSRSPESSPPFLGVWANQPPPRGENCSPDAPAELGVLGREAPEPRPNATAESSLPPIANPFDDSELNSRFQQYPQVPLPIHRGFEYAPKRSRRRSPVSARMRAKPLIIWTAVLALVCFGANALVRYKINQTSRRFASETSKSTPAVAPSGSDPIAATHAAADSQTDANLKPEAGLDTGASAAAPSTGDTAGTASSVPSVGVSPRQSGAKDSDANHSAADRESSLDTDGGTYVATAPPALQHSDESTRSSQPVARTWSAPAPNRSSSPTFAGNDLQQSPNIASSITGDQSSAIPAVTQSRPGPPAADQSSVANNAGSGAVAPTTSKNSASNPPARTQQSSGSQQIATYAANSTSGNSASGNTTQAHQQSQIYNANAAPQQRSAIIGSINSVHSSGIFDSNDTTTANAAPAAAARGSSNANANVSTRNVANNSVAPIDSPQERDLEIAAPKGFTASYVDLPGEHLVRTATATVRMRRFVRVPGERIPGQRWLWRGKLNVTLGDVVNRIDPSIVQGSGATGSLTVQATIDKDGYVTDLKPINGNFAMLPSVSRAVRNWHYEPTYLDNKRADTLAEIEFDLRPTAANNRTQR